MYRTQTCSLCEISVKKQWSQGCVKHHLHSCYSVIPTHVHLSLNFPAKAHSTPSFSNPVFSTPVIWCHVFHSRVFHPATWCHVFHSCVFHHCHLVPRFPLLRFPPLSSGATFSTPAFSAPPDNRSDCTKCEVNFPWQHFLPNISLTSILQWSIICRFQFSQTSGHTPHLSFSVGGMLSWLAVSFWLTIHSHKVQTVCAHSNKVSDADVWAPSAMPVTPALCTQAAQDLLNEHTAAAAAAAASTMRRRWRDDDRYYCTTFNCLTVHNK